MLAHTDFVAYPSRSRDSLLISGAAVFIAIGCWMAGIFGPVPATSRYSEAFTVAFGWLGMLFFGACLIAGVKRLFETEEEVRIGLQGVRVRRSSDQTIPWIEITDVSTLSYKKSRTIVLHLRDPSLFPGRGLYSKLDSMNRGLTGGDIAISLTGTDRSVDEALAAIAAARAKIVH
jgi:hypothetical protein